jgi:hypothetical protein
MNEGAVSHFPREPKLPIFRSNKPTEGPTRCCCGQAGSTVPQWAIVAACRSPGP